jgi:hypothetical protein
MTSFREDYVILSEVLRKMGMDENYQPTDRELKVVAKLLVANFLEQEEKNSLKRSIRKNLLI